MTLHISDTRTGEKRPFTPRDGPVRIYVCGMTPKAPPHVGHGFMFVHMDVVRRYLEHRGYKVRHLQNFTDIDDKIIDRARPPGRTRSRTPRLRPGRTSRCSTACGCATPTSTRQ